MATAEMAAMLDELMGRNRNAHPNDKVDDITWEDESVCKYYLVSFCPHEVFTNTKVDLGTCHKIHDDELRKAYQQTKEGYKKFAVEDEFVRFCEKMLSDLGLKIRRSRERIVLTQMEQAAAAASNNVSQEKQDEIEEKIAILTDKINTLVDQAEKAGSQGDVEEAQGVLKLCDQLRNERTELKSQIVGSSGGSGESRFGPSKAMEVCEICGSFLVIGDAQSRIDDHLNGKQHLGFSKLKTSLDEILETRKQRRETREKELESERHSAKRSKSRDRRSRDKRRSRSRSRDRDRGERDRDRDRERRRRSRSSERRKGSSRRSRSRSRDNGGGGHRRRDRRS